MKKTTLILLSLFIAISSSITTLAFEKTSGILETFFPDVEDDAYYTQPILDMAFAGIMTGYEDGNFGPNDPVTRGQLATTLQRYDQKLVGSNASTGLGVADLTYLICEGFAESDFEDEASKQIYNDVCYIQ